MYAMRAQGILPQDDGLFQIGPGPTPIPETTDAPSDVSTPYVLQVGEIFTGELDAVSDRDWMAITLTAGETYQFDLLGSANGHGTLGDPYLRLRDATGNYVAHNDDGGYGLNSRLVFTAPDSATYYLSAGGYADSSAGTYLLTANIATPPGTGSLPLATPDELADYLTDGFWQDSGLSPRSFDTSASNQITVNITGLSAEGQQLARWALESWEMVADIVFVEVTSGGDILFENTGSGAYSQSTVQGTTIQQSTVNVSQDFVTNNGTAMGSYAFQTFLQDIGHALGLGLPGLYNNALLADPAARSFGNDTWQMSVMSSFSQYDDTSGTYPIWGRPVTPMLADILAIQALYGAPGAGSATAGDTTYGANTTLSNAFGQFFTAFHDTLDPAIYNGGSVTFTLYDQGGVDTLDLSTERSDLSIDLTPGTQFHAGYYYGTLAIAPGTMIERLITGHGYDQLFGNAADNFMSGNDGFDQLWGADGNDTLLGGADGDLMGGGGGDDDLSGGTGQDTLYGDTGDDRAAGGEGHDALWGGQGQDTLLGEAGNDVGGGGAGHDVVHGDAGADTLFGGLGNDFLSGGTDDDRLFGGDGDDMLLGGAGDDELRAGSGDDNLWGEDGADLLLAGAGNDLAGGGAGDDVLWGGAGHDTLFGGADDDLLGGGLGHDVLWGGTGDDVLYGVSGRDVLAGEAGSDLVWGGDSDDTLLGGGGDDTLIGGEGDDVLDGGAGRDTLVFVPGSGDDLVMGFSLTEDILQLDDALWAGAGPLSAAQVVNGFASVVGSDIVLSFAGGESITIQGLTDLTGLAGAFDIV